MSGDTPLRVSIRRYLIAFLGLGVLMLAAPRLAAQTAPVTGVPPLSTVQTLPEGVLNLGDLNLHVAVPIVNKAGRGTPLTYTLGFDSDVWTPVTNGTWTPAFNWGWTTETDAFTGYVTYQASPQQCAYGNSYPPQMYNFTLYENFIYYDQFGAAHLINMEPLQYPTGLPCGPNYPSSNSATAQDGSGLTLYASDNYGGTPSAAVVFRSGAHITPPVYLAGSAAANGAGTFVDPNGNEITTSGSTYTDTLGVAELSVGGSATPASPLTLSYPGPGGSETATVHYTSQSVATGFTCNKNYSGTANLPTSIALADGETYDFGYGGAGRITSITLPTGATISYAYSGGSGGINCQDGSPATLTRTVDGQSWTYVHSVGSNSIGTTTVTDPAGNVTTYTFYDDYEVERVVSQGSGSTLETVYTCYNSGAACTGPGGSFTLPITSRAVVTLLPNGQEEETVTDYDGYGDPAEVDQYDWGSGSPGSLLRKTLISYAALSGIADRPNEVLVEDGSGNPVAETAYAYDQTALQATSGLPQHTSAPNSSRGNPTTVYQCAAFSGGSCARWLTSTLSYFDTGEVYQATAPDGAVTTFAYDSSSPGCAGGFPTGVTLPQDAQGNSYSLQYSWNCNGGVLASATGENGNVTSYAYSDPLWRLTGVSDPDTGVTGYSYAPNTVEKSMAFNGGSSTVDTLVTLDSLGQPEFEQSRQGPGATTFDTVETTYNADGQVSGVSEPYPGTAGQAAPTGTKFSAMVYDALGRPETITAANGAVTSYTYTGPAVTVTGPAPGDVTHILQANGLGELAEVCEVTNLSGSGACNTAAGGTGYLTTYSYDALGDLTGVDEAGQTRSFSYDALGRMTAETTPESGTTTFIYDTAGSGCGNYSAPGSLVEREDSMATVDVTCYESDPFGRVTSITYPSGQYASVTPPKYFVYDAATVDGAAMANAKGRLAEAYTGPSSAKITDEGFGYDVMGRPTDLYEMAPSSSGYYHSQESYWPDGAVATLTIPGVPEISYAPNAMGEVATVSASGQNPVTSTSYNVAGQLTAITYGSGDADAFAYHATTGLMESYAFDINGQTETGTLNWNADGTLGSLDISDPFDAGDTQDCSFTQDDLGRLASVNCGSEWSQTFSTDAFGDVAVTSGNDAFPAQFANDRISSVNGFAPNYDANGNLLDNPLTQARNVYGWDADGRPVEVDGASQTYDAFGRLVYNSSSPAEYIWTPDGSKAANMNGQNLNFAGVPLPGGAVAMYSSGGLWYYAHPDWEGSWRLASSPSRTATGELAYSPYGAAYAGSGPDAFTGQWVDTPDNLNDFQHRLLAPMMARWLSPDPSGPAAVNPANPQSWNAYAYVANQPLTATDPLGLNGNCSGPQTPADGPVFVICPDTTVTVSANAPPGLSMMQETLLDFYVQIASMTAGNAPPAGADLAVTTSGGGGVSPAIAAAHRAGAGPTPCVGGPHVVFSASAGATPGLGGGEAVASVTSSPSAASGSGSVGVNAVEGTPQAYAGVSFGITGLVGPTTGAVTVGAGELGRATLTIPFTNRFPYVDGAEVGGGVVAATTPVQVAISVNGPQGVKCW